MLKKLLSTALLFAFILGLGLSTEASELSEPCGLSEKELEDALEFELKKYAGDFLLAENEHGVSAALLAAIASLESGHGRYMFRENNIFGWSGKDFASVPECIDFVAKKLKENYIDPEGKYYRGGTIKGIATVYCPGITLWAEKVEFFYYKILESKKQNEKIYDKSRSVIACLK